MFIKSKNNSLLDGLEVNTHTEQPRFKIYYKVQVFLEFVYFY